MSEVEVGGLGGLTKNEVHKVLSIRQVVVTGSPTMGARLLRVMGPQAKSFRAADLCVSL